jgi:hypothetical protein
MHFTEVNRTLVFGPSFVYTYTFFLSLCSRSFFFVIVACLEYFQDYIHPKYVVLCIVAQLNWAQMSADPVLILATNCLLRLMSQIFISQEKGRLVILLCQWFPFFPLPIRTAPGRHVALSEHREQLICYAITRAGNNITSGEYHVPLWSARLKKQ